MKERIFAYKTAIRELTKEEMEAVVGSGYVNNQIGTAASPDTMSGSTADDCGTDWG